MSQLFKSREQTQKKTQAEPVYPPKNISFTHHGNITNYVILIGINMILELITDFKV